MRSTILIIILGFTIASLFGQEVIVDIIPAKLASKKYLDTQLQLKQQEINDTLNIPFFDDFASTSVFPDNRFWLDMSGFINNGYAYNPISRGVASLDVLDSVGAVYTHLSWQVSDVAEYLTSKPLNLDYEVADSLYLSFFYQCGGNGDVPEYSDWLVLEFTTPDTTWHSVWKTQGGLPSDTFYLAMIPIRDEYLLKDGFQFRFKNYASLSSNYELSFKMNVDIWNVDYVYLDTARTFADTVIEDVAFIRNFHSLVKNFESVPWEHFKLTADINTLDTLAYIYKNSGPNVQNINRQLIITDVYDGAVAYSNLDDNENIEAFSTLEYYKHISDFSFNTSAEDSALYLVKGFLKTDTTAARRPYRWNDTINFNQYFYNYYAYDDGSSEKGYGIGGQGTSGASFAYQFTPIKADTLRGVNMFFNQVIDGHNINYFYLTVWQNNNGIPGDTLIQQVGVRPMYSDSINEFCYYALERPVFIDTTFYIGWVKTTDDMLNVGYDINRNAGEHVFFNTTGSWQQSIYSGAPMIRPVFGKKELAISVPDRDLINIQVYPNPVTDILFVEIGSDESFNYDIIDINGRILSSGSSNKLVPVHDLEAGFYILQLFCNGQKVIKRIIVNR
jgi:hypothetical protein